MSLATFTTSLDMTVGKNSHLRGSEGKGGVRMVRAANTNDFGRSFFQTSNFSFLVSLLTVACQVPPSPGMKDDVMP